MEEKPIKASRQRSIEDELDEILKNEAKESKMMLSLKKFLYLMMRILNKYEN